MKQSSTEHSEVNCRRIYVTVQEVGPIFSGWALNPAGAVPMTIVDVIRASQTMDL